MASRDVADRERHRQHRQTECEGDSVKADPQTGKSGRQNGASAPPEHQPKGSEKLRAETFRDGHRNSPSPSVTGSRAAARGRPEATRDWKRKTKENRELSAPVSCTFRRFDPDFSRSPEASARSRRTTCGNVKRGLRRSLFDGLLGAGPDLSSSGRDFDPQVSSIYILGFP